MSKRPQKYPWNGVPTCQRPYKPCAVENVSSRYPGWCFHMGKIRKISSSVTEISVAGPARLLIWTHRNFCKEKSGEARSRKPSQPGQPGSYEEALSQQDPEQLVFVLKPGDENGGLTAVHFTTIFYKPNTGNRVSLLTTLCMLQSWTDQMKN